MMRALLEAAPPRRLNPATEMTSATPSTSRTIALARSTAASVRASEAPAGSCTLTKKAPLSSSGRKPVGAARNRNTAPPAKAAKSSIERPLRRIIPPTKPGVAVAHPPHHPGEHARPARPPPGV